MGQRVLITGISRFLGGKLAQRLERDPDVEYVVGVDLDEPEVDLDKTEYVRTDIRNPLIVKVLQATEIEQYARDFGRRRPDVDVSILRFANFIGPDIETTLTRYFSLPVIPTAMGYDPRIQLIHENDAVEVLHRSVREAHPGIYNVAG